MLIPRLLDVSDDRVSEAVNSQLSLWSGMNDPDAWHQATEKVWGAHMATPIGEPRIWWPSRPFDRPHHQLSQVYKFPDGTLAIIGTQLIEGKTEWFVEVDGKCRKLAVLLPPSGNGDYADGGIFQDWDERKEKKLLQHAEAISTRKVFTDADFKLLDKIGVPLEDDRSKYRKRPSIEAVQGRTFKTLIALYNYYFTQFSTKAQSEHTHAASFHDNAQALFTRKDFAKFFYGFRVRFRDTAYMYQKARMLVGDGVSTALRIIDAGTNNTPAVISVRPKVQAAQKHLSNLGGAFQCAAVEITKGVYLTVAEAFGQDIGDPSAVIRRGLIGTTTVKPLAINYKHNVALFKVGDSDNNIASAHLGNFVPYAEAQILLPGNGGSTKSVEVMSSTKIQLAYKSLFGLTGVMDENAIGAPVIQDGKLVGIVAHNYVEEFDHQGKPRPEWLQGIAYATPIDDALKALNVQVHIDASKKKNASVPRKTNWSGMVRKVGVGATVFGGLIVAASLVAGGYYLSSSDRKNDSAPPSQDDAHISNAFVATKQLNVRNAPDNGNILGTLKCGDGVHTANGITERWTEIILPDGQHAYVGSRYIAPSPPTVQQCQP